MSLVDTINHMKKSLPRYASELPGLGARNPSLAAYGSPDAVVAALDPKSGLSHAERGRMVAALVGDHQKQGGQLAQRILAVAFEYTLVAVRTRLRRPKNEDLDQRVLMTFLEVLLRRSIVNAGDFAPIALARETKKAVFGGIRSNRRTEIPTGEFDDETYVSGDLFERANDKSDAALERAQRFLDNASDELRDVLMETVAGEQSIKEYVDRALPGADDRQRTLAYERLRHQRYEAMQSLRALEDVAP